MGASDMPVPKMVGLVHQEIVCTVHSASPDATENMTKHIIKNGISNERFKVGWDTWRGTTFAPPPDSLPWTAEELLKIKCVLETHSNTVCVDTTPGNGSGG